MKPTVKAGQIWSDNDSRISERYILVLEVGPEKALCVNCDKWGRYNTTRRSRIQLCRFRPNSTGYVLERGTGAIRQ